jgi:polyhydroxyalkanoate synthesis regulator phasin
MSRRNKLVAGGAALLVAVAAGGAIAATKLTPGQESQAVIDDAAKQLGVQPRELSNALKQALKNRVDDAVKDGRLTEEQGRRMKQRIDAGGVPLFGLGRHGFHDHHRKGIAPHMLVGGKAVGAAEYLGMERREMFRALSNGKTLADLARERDKSVDGLIDAMVEATEKRLDEAVAEGKLTEADKNQVLGDVRERITRLVNEGFPAPRFESKGSFFMPSVF